MAFPIQIPSLDRFLVALFNLQRKSLEQFCGLLCNRYSNKSKLKMRSARKFLSDVQT